MSKILALILVLAFLSAVRGGMEPDPPPLNMVQGRAPYFPVCDDIDPHCE